jgi:hypothetical protein
MKSRLGNSWIGGVIAALCLSITSLPFAPMALGVGATAVVMPMAGCSVSPAQIESSINVALQSAEAVLASAEPGASWVNPFKAAVTALQNAEASWKGGGAIPIVESALNTLASVSAVIPFTAPYAPLVAILVAGIDAVLSSLPVTATAGATLAAPMTTPYRGKAKLNGRSMLHPTHEGAYKAQWNAVAKANPLLTAAILK